MRIRMDENNCFVRIVFALNENIFIFYFFFIGWFALLEIACVVTMFYMKIRVKSNIMNKAVANSFILKLTVLFDIQWLLQWHQDEREWKNCIYVHSKMIYCDRDSRSRMRNGANDTNKRDEKKNKINDSESRIEIASQIKLPHVEMKTNDKREKEERTMSTRIQPKKHSSITMRRQNQSVCAERGSRSKCRAISVVIK